jgi:predicted DNA-binding transcriptional regulator AlpA
MASKVDPANLIDAEAVAEILGLAQRTSVSVYQKRYPSMPRPVVDMGRGRCKLWLRSEIERWAKARAVGSDI